MASRRTYDLSVFLNCPFDKEYRRLLDAAVFTVHDCGFHARSALEIYDSGQVRIEKITRLIQECRFGLHDLSRVGLDEHNQLPRFNMPLELGIFLGAKWLGSPKQKRKSALVLDSEPYRYQAFCSDIAGQDIAAHEHDVSQAVRHIRDWLRAARPEIAIPSGKRIWRRFESFETNLPSLCESMSLEIEELTFTDFTALVSYWLADNPW